MSRTRGALSKKRKGKEQERKEGEKRSRRFWRMLAAREDERVDEESKDPTGEEGRILACVVDGKAKGCKWEREEGSKESRQGGRQAGF